MEWFARPPLWPFYHWRSLINESQPTSANGLKGGGWWPRIQAWNLTPFLTGGIHKNQNDALAGELMIKIFDKDQNGVIYVNDLYYLEEAFPSESGCACPWVLAIWPQNDSQAGLDASLFIHNAVRQTRTSLWITNVARWLAQGPPLWYTNQHGHMMGNNVYFTWICKTKHKAYKRFYHIYSLLPLQD